MNTSIRGTRRQGAARDTLPRIIAGRFVRWLALLLLAGTLTACSAARLAYNQAPALTYWWLDGHVDFNNGQSEAARQGIDTFFDWHRNEALPEYVELLRAWQSMALEDLDADRVCAQFDVIRNQLDAAAGRAVPPLARLAQTLTPSQLDHQRRHQSKSNRGFERDFLLGDETQRLRKRLTTAIDRSERIYGRLSTEQRELVRDWLQRSPWDPARTLAERQRRQADLLQTVSDIQARPDQAEALVAAHIRRIGQSPNAGYQEYSRSLAQHGCAQFAALHNSTTVQQRERALRTLKGYEEDLSSLANRR